MRRSNDYKTKYGSKRMRDFRNQQYLHEINRDANGISICRPSSHETSGVEWIINLRYNA